MMDQIIVEGGVALTGTVQTSGAKNAALPLLFSTLLADGRHEFTNVPCLRDIDSTQNLLADLGAVLERQGESQRVVVDVQRPKKILANYELVRKMRASILCLGPLLARYGEAQVSLPGGCAIGTRPINLHLDVLKEMGAEIEVKSGYVHAKAKELVGTTILFDQVTVGGTENLLMAATLAKGKTIIENAAKEPEVVDLVCYLSKMGAQIKGAGTSVIEVEGVNELFPSSHHVLPDRIEAGTLLIAGAISKGRVKVSRCIPRDLEALIQKLRDAGFTLNLGDDWIEVLPATCWKGVDISTYPHPLFPTDLQAQFMALMTVAEGTSVIAETVFENRFMHVQELIRMGAEITPRTQVAVVRGRGGFLSGAPVMATDLRASASLVLAGLAARGETVISRVYHLDRGYEKLEKKLASLGAKVKRVSQ